MERKSINKEFYSQAKIFFYNKGKIKCFSSLKKRTNSANSLSEDLHLKYSSVGKENYAK